MSKKWAPARAPTWAPARQPKYVPPRKGKAKVPKDLDAIDNILITPSIPKGVLFNGMMIGRIPTMKFKDWDLVDTEKFPHLEISELMEQSAEGAVTKLQPQEWLRKVEEGWATLPPLNSTFSTACHYNIGHQTTALLGTRWLLMDRQTHPHHGRAHS